MADITLTVFDTKRTSNGVNVTDQDTTVTNTDTYYVPNNGRVVLLVNSTPGCTVTVETPGTVDGLAITDYTATIAAAKQHVLGPFPGATYNKADGTIKVTFSAAADVLAVRM